jgi:iron complex transport system substrate-binding protein
LLALTASVAAAEPRQVVDGAGRGVTVSDTSRVVSLGGSVTEILYGLGLEDRIAAVDTTSLYPPDALSEKPNVGYLRALSAEGVLSVGPSLILAEDDAGPAEAVALLESASVPFLRVPSEETAEGAVAKIRFVGAVMDASSKADALADRVAADLEALRVELTAIERPIRVLFILSLAGDRIMAAGEDTSAAAILHLAGAENALSGFTGYKPVNAEAVLAAAPEAIVIMARSGGGNGPGLAAEEVLANPALASTPAGRAGHVVAMNGLYLLGFGPRVADAARDLAAALYPNRALPELAARPRVGLPGSAQ